LTGSGWYDDEVIVTIPGRSLWVQHYNNKGSSTVLGVPYQHFGIVERRRAASAPSDNNFIGAATSRRHTKESDDCSELSWLGEAEHWKMRS
jgi:hypothetical protein